MLMWPEVLSKDDREKAFYVEKVFDLCVHVWKDGNRTKSTTFIFGSLNKRQDIAPESRSSSFSCGLFPWRRAHCRAGSATCGRGDASGAPDVSAALIKGG